MRITGLETSIRSLGDTIEDTRIVYKLLRIGPSQFAQVAISTKTLLDLHTLSIEELTCRLWVVEDHLNDGHDTLRIGQILLTKKERETKKRRFHDDGTSSSSVNPTEVKAATRAVAATMGASQVSPNNRVGLRLVPMMMTRQGATSAASGLI